MRTLIQHTLGQLSVTQLIVASIFLVALIMATGVGLYLLFERIAIHIKQSLDKPVDRSKCLPDDRDKRVPMWVPLAFLLICLVVYFADWLHHG